MVCIWEDYDTKAPGVLSSYYRRSAERRLRTEMGRQKL